MPILLISDPTTVPYGATRSCHRSQRPELWDNILERSRHFVGSGERQGALDKTRWVAKEWPKITSREGTVSLDLNEFTLAVSNAVFSMVTQNQVFIELVILMTKYIIVGIWILAKSSLVSLPFNQTYKWLKGNQSFVTHANHVASNLCLIIVKLIL